MVFDKPRLVIAALRGGAGKTFVSLGIAAAWRLFHEKRVVPFKKGPDYIDAGWLSVAAQHPCYNLDPFLMQSEEMLCSFVHRSSRGDVSLIEGNRGLYDGVDVQGSFSTAELAKFLRAPVVLVLDATKVTRTAAALVLGCQQLDPNVHIAGVILNRVAGKRHEDVLRGAIEQFCRVPVLGVIPKESQNLFPERHLGLVPHQESDRCQESMERAARRMEECVDTEALWNVARSAGILGWPALSAGWGTETGAQGQVVIGVIRDSAFQFYYPENLEALAERGAVLKEISSFEDRPLPDVDALYIGGGFPETHLSVLAGNKVFRESLRKSVEAGLPVYAECGGLMFLCQGIRHQSGIYPMAGVFPYDVVLEAKPQGHGYTVLQCVRDNPFFEHGGRFLGHEFHYSRIVGIPQDTPFVFSLEKGYGIVDGWDGLCYKGCLAGYSHIHAVGNSQWALSMVSAARNYRTARLGVLDRTVDSRRCVSDTSEYLIV